MFDFFEKYKEEKEKELLKKLYAIRHYIIQFYKEKEKESESVELPAWVQAKYIMDELKINIDNPKKINFYYDKLKKYKLNKLFSL